jgi:hypothetical protein
VIGFEDGPAQGETLFLHRAPRFLRVVIDRDSGKVDALDQLDDTPAPAEAVHVYEIEGSAGWVHLNMGGSRRGTGFYASATYRHRPDVDGEQVRDNAAWQAWARAQPVEREVPAPKPTPMDLWQEADGDRDRYIALMKEHGHLVPGKRPEGEDIFGHRIKPERGGR